jgi:ubiquitin-conjugating enzyme E2 O
VGEDLRPRLAADIERVRIAMSKLEERFNESPKVPMSGNTMRQLLDVYKDCKYVDRLLNSKFFDEEHFEGLVEKVRIRSGKMGNAQQAMADHVSRMFPDDSSEKEEEEKKEDTTAESEVIAASASPSKSLDKSYQWQMSEKERVEKDDRQLCAKLCSLMKDQLVKCHEEATRLHGGQNAMFSPEDLAEGPDEASYDLEGIMGAILGATRQQIGRQLTALFSPFVPPASMARLEAEEDSSEGKKEGDINDEEEASPSGVSALDISNALYGPKQETEKEEEKAENAAASLVEAEKHEGKYHFLFLFDRKVHRKRKGNAYKVRLVWLSSVLFSFSLLTNRIFPFASSDSFSVAESAPASHRFKLALFQPKEPKAFIKFVRKEVNLLKTALPRGIAVKAFEDRMVGRLV